MTTESETNGGSASAKSGPLRLAGLANLLPDVFSGLISALVALVYAISCAALIFSGDFTRHMEMGLSAGLVSATVLGLIMALTSSFHFTMAGPDQRAAAILALVAISISSGGMSSDLAAHTLWITIIVGSLITGLFLFLLGKCQLGRFIRFIPYPVVGGFLAGTGWLLSIGAFKVMTGFQPRFEELQRLFGSGVFPLWITGVAFAIVLLLILNRFRHYLILPSLLVATTGLCYLLLWAGGISPSAAREKGWLFQQISGAAAWPPWQFFQPHHVDWIMVLKQASSLAAMAIVMAITILLGATGLELTMRTDTDLDRELRAYGIANVIGGLCGGMAGCLSLNRSLLHHAAGARTRLAGVMSSLICGAVLLFNLPVLIYLPKPILGGLLLFLGLSLLVEWLYRAWFKLSRIDYAIIILILLVVAGTGFLQGVTLGVVVAAIFFAFNYSRINVVKHALSGADHHSNVDRSEQEQQFLREQGGQIHALWLQGYIFFGTANTLLEQVRARVHAAKLPPVRFIMMNFAQVSGVDSSAVLSFLKMVQLAQAGKITLVFTNLKNSIREQLEQGKCLDPAGQFSRVFPDLDHGLEWCEEQILHSGQAREIKTLPLEEQLRERFGDEAAVRQFMRYLERLEVAAGFYLFRQREPSSNLYFVESGRVTVLLELRGGQTKRLRTMGAGTVVGEMGMYLKSPRSASVVTDAPSCLYCLTLASLEKLQEQEPHLASLFHQFIVRLLATRLANADKEVEALLMEVEGQ